MNLIDLLIIAPLVYAGYKGFKRGFIIEVFTFLALIVGIYAGIHFSDYCAAFLKNKLFWNSTYLPVVSFSITFLLVGAMIYFAGKTIEQMIKVVHLTPLNKFFGVLFAVGKMAYFVSVMIVIVESYDEKSHFLPTEKKDESLFFKPVKKIAATTIPGLNESTIFYKNALRPEADSTGLTAEQIIQTRALADSLGIAIHNANDLKRIHEEYVKMED
jgi:membrane protein required for colicin V production